MEDLQAQFHDLPACAVQSTAYEPISRQGVRAKNLAPAPQIYDTTVPGGTTEPENWLFGAT